MSKHTKGPWYLTWETSCVHTADEGSSIVCDDNATKGDLTLIAAAPDLLEELKHLVTIIKPFLESGGNIPGLATLNGANKAIAKAEQGDGE